MEHRKHFLQRLRREEIVFSRDTRLVYLLQHQQFHQGGRPPHHLETLQPQTEDRREQAAGQVNRSNENVIRKYEYKGTDI